MSSFPETQLLKKMSVQLVPDLTKALKLFKSRIVLLLKLVKNTPEEYLQIIEQISLQESELISKYEGIDSFLLSGYQMEFQRLFCRMIQTLQAEKKNTQLESYISEIEGIIYQTITNNKSDYIASLSKIYSKGQGITKTIVSGDNNLIVKNVRPKPLILTISKTEKRIVETPERKGVNYSSMKSLTGLDLDLNYRRDSYLYIPTHQDETYSEMSERNRYISGDISLYSRVYTENTARQQRKSQKAKRLIVSHNGTSMSQTQIYPIACYNPQEQCEQNTKLNFQNKCNTTAINSFKNYRAFSMSKENKKYGRDSEIKTSSSFRQTQQTFSRQITPKKIFFCFNKLALRPADEIKPAQFNVRKKTKQVCQTKVKVKDSMFQILIEGKKIEDDMLELVEIKRKITARGSSSLFIGSV